MFCRNRYGLSNAVNRLSLRCVVLEMLWGMYSPPGRSKVSQTLGRARVTVFTTLNAAQRGSGSARLQQVIHLYTEVPRGGGGGMSGGAAEWRRGGGRGYGADGQTGGLTASRCGAALTEVRQTTRAVGSGRYGRQPQQ